MDEPTSAATQASLSRTMSFPCSRRDSPSFGCLTSNRPDLDTRWERVEQRTRNLYDLALSEMVHWHDELDGCAAFAQDLDQRFAARLGDSPASKRGHHRGPTRGPTRPRPHESVERVPPVRSRRSRASVRRAAPGSAGRSIAIRSRALASDSSVASRSVSPAGPRRKAHIRSRLPSKSSNTC